MCGIAGVVDFRGAPVAEETLTAMGAALAHRGPDAQGLLQEAQGAPSVGFVHRRLSIIDLSSAADQPIGGEDGSVQVMLNGEIYNYRELRQQLQERHRFRSQGDTEAIAHLYEDVGDAAIERLDGMFALAIWDARRRRLLLARDAFGKKPLYYWSDGSRFVFGSEVKALLAAGVPAEMEEDALGEYLAFGYVPTPRSFYRGVHKVPAASVLVVDGSGVGRPRRYWDLEFPRDGAAAEVDRGEARARVRELLERAVRKRLLADVPLGVLLSGGVDSSAIAALVAREQRNVKTFTIGFEGDAFYDERPYAAEVARHLGTEHHATVVRPDAASLMATLLHHHDEPFGDSSALPTYLVAREARRHVTVAINGDGGDETFAGYDRFHAALLADRIPQLLRRAMGVGARVLPAGRHHHGFPRRLRRFAEKAALPFEERLFAWSAFMDLGQVHALLPAPAVSRDQVLSSYQEALARQPEASLLSRILYVNARTYLLDDLLPKMDRMTMAHGLEARSPLLDRALMEYVATLPDHLKRQGSAGKVILKEATADLLPPSILRRPKHGFGVPLGTWFRGDLKPLLTDTLLGRPRLGGRLQVARIRHLVDEHLDGRSDHGHVLWLLLVLELWMRKHGFA